MIEQKDDGKILVIEVVEDDASLLGILRDKLTLEGFRVLEAKNGHDGMVTALQERPDLILLDIVMPEMDGLTMMKKLREHNDWGKKVPIILLTNLNSNDEKIMKAIVEDEPAYYLTKSNWSIDDLMSKIRERLSRKY